MNLVSVEHVVDAVLFSVSYEQDFKGQVVIISDDDNQRNNFEDVEAAILDGLKLPYYKLPRVRVPCFVLRSLLLAMRRNSINPQACFSEEKLARLGFRKSVSFDDSLAAYIASYRKAIDHVTEIDTR